MQKYVQISCVKQYLHVLRWMTYVLPCLGGVDWVDWQIGCTNLKPLGSLTCGPNHNVLLNQPPKYLNIENFHVSKNC